VIPQVIQEGGVEEEAGGERSKEEGVWSGEL
jgi:hypothetical protein